MSGFHERHRDEAMRDPEFRAEYERARAEDDGFIPEPEWRPAEPELALPSPLEYLHPAPGRAVDG